MMTKHTPGPWLREIGTCEVWYVQTQDGRPIAIVERGEQLDGEEHLANANLIAAAPDMAEALRAANDLLVAIAAEPWFEVTRGIEMGVCAVNEQARAALEKAGVS